MNLNFKHKFLTVFINAFMSKVTIKRTILKILGCIGIFACMYLPTLLLCSQKNSLVIQNSVAEKIVQLGVCFI